MPINQSTFKTNVIADFLAFDQCKTNQTNSPLAVGELQQDTKVIQSSDLSPSP
jgi:hypothetical protein